MNSGIIGETIFHSEVTNIDEFGFWVLVDSRLGAKEYFIPFSDYPGFKDATIRQIHAVEQASPDQLHWAELDEDIDIAALEFPEKFPLIFKRA